MSILSGCFTGSGRRIVFHGPHAAVEIENLAQGDVEGADAAADGRGQRAFDRDAKFADGADGVVGKPVLKAGLGLLAGKHFVPSDAALALVRLFDCGVENANRCLPDIAARAIPLNKGMMG